MSPAPPTIVPVPADVPRPRWSVMIPTYNCANYLGETLRSVLDQDPGPQAMQIEVVDDCSTKDDPGAVVREIGGGRVAFHRQPANVGPTANFNTCITRSRGHLVHILHGDDLAEPAFYETIKRIETVHPNLALYACRGYIIDAAGGLQMMTPRCPDLETPTMEGRALWYGNFLPTPGVVIRRDFYERHGGFSPEFCHVADWEMWWRALSREGGIQINQPLVRYRSFGGSDTGRLARSAENLRDYLRLGSLMERSEPAFDAVRFRAYVAHQAWEQSARFETLRDPAAAHANARLWSEITPLSAKIRMCRAHPRATLRRLFSQPV